MIGKPETYETFCHKIMIIKKKLNHKGTIQKESRGIILFLIYLRFQLN